MLWCIRAKARDELRLQAGYVRFDLATLAASMPMAEKVKALALKKDFIAKVCQGPGTDEGLHRLGGCCPLQPHSATRPMH